MLSIGEEDGFAEALVWPPVSRGATGHDTAPAGTLPDAEFPEARRDAALQAAWQASGCPSLLLSGPAAQLEADPPRAYGGLIWVGAERATTAARTALLTALLGVRGDPVITVEAEPAVLGELAEWLAAVPAAWDGRVRFRAIVGRPGEWPERVTEAVAVLLKCGVPLLADLRLLRGQLDGDLPIETLRDTCRALTRRGVRPTALLSCDWLPAALRVPPGEALEMASGLRGWISGVAAPQAVLETSGGRRSALVPERVQSMEEGQVAVSNYRGDRYEYRDPPDVQSLSDPPEE